MPDSTPVKNGLVPAGAQMMSAWLVNDGCDFMKQGALIIIVVSPA